MRSIVFVFFFFLILGLFAFVTILDYSFWGLLFAIFTMSVVGWIFADKAILFFLGAREVIAGDQHHFYNSALQEAYKLGIPQPKTYIYQGNFERGFVLHNRKNVSLIISRSFLQKVRDSELSGICFSLLLQVKNKQAKKRTRVLFLIGGISWMVNSFCSFISILIPAKEIKTSLEWIFTYFLTPFLELVFKLSLGKAYFIHLNEQLLKFPQELNLLKLAVLKLNKFDEIHSLASQKTLQFYTANKRTNLKNILALEMLPHEWDTL